MTWLQFLAALTGLAFLVVVATSGRRIARAWMRERKLAAKTWCVIVVGACVVLLVDVPLGHSSNCGIAPGTNLVGSWMPYAFYASAATLCALLVLPDPYVQHRVTACYALVFLGAVTALTSALTAPIGPWWAVHVVYQGLLLALVLSTLRPEVWGQALLVPSIAFVLPFWAPTFWHACARIRPGDDVQEVMEHLAPYWIIPPWARSTSERVRVGELDFRRLEEEQQLLFAATGDSHADTCHVELEAGRVRTYHASPD